MAGEFPRPTSFPAAEDLGFIALTLSGGGSVWLAAASIYAVETTIGENFSTVKTMAEPLGVLEDPETIFQEIADVQERNAEREKARAVEDFLDYIAEYNLKVVIEPEEGPVVLRESDDRAKAWRAHRAAQPTVINDVALKQAGMTSDQIAEVHRQQDAANFESAANAEFGMDLDDALDQIRKRAQEGDS